MFRLADCFFRPPVPGPSEDEEEHQVEPDTPRAQQLSRARLGLFPAPNLCPSAAAELRTLLVMAERKLWTKNL